MGVPRAGSLDASSLGAGKTLVAISSSALESSHYCVTRIYPTLVGLGGHKFN